MDQSQKAARSYGLKTENVKKVSSGTWCLLSSSVFKQFLITSSAPVVVGYWHKQKLCALQDVAIVTCTIQV